MTTTTVVHCMRSRWDVYIGRPNPKIPPQPTYKWGNQWKIGDVINRIVLTRKHVIDQYESWLMDSAEGYRLRLQARRELHGKVLGCWCHPQACHGDVLAMAADTKPAPIDRFIGEYTFLSNFYPSPFLYDGLIWPTSEHAYQAAKTNDRENKLKIQSLNSPGYAKRYGRTVTIRPNWEKLKVNVMYDILLAKFSDSKLRRMLVDTADADLIEGNTWDDRYWGVVNGTGENNLGKLLMLVRDDSC